MLKLKTVSDNISNLRWMLNEVAISFQAEEYEKAGSVEKWKFYFTQIRVQIITIILQLCLIIEWQI